MSIRKWFDSLFSSSTCSLCDAGLPCPEHGAKVASGFNTPGLKQARKTEKEASRRLEALKKIEAEEKAKAEKLVRLERELEAAQKRIEGLVTDVVRTERSVEAKLATNAKLGAKIVEADHNLYQFAATPLELLLEQERSKVPSSAPSAPSAPSNPTGKEDNNESGSAGKGAKPESKKPVVVAQLVAAGFSETQAEFICNKSRGGQKVVDSYVDYLNTTEDGNRAGEVARIAVIMCGDPGFYQNLWRKWLPKAAPTTPSGGRRNPDVSTASSGVGGTEIPDPDFSTPEVPSKEAGQRLRGGQPTSIVPSGDGVDFVSV